MGNIIDVCTRGNSTCAVIGSVIEQQAAIVAIFSYKKGIKLLGAHSNWMAVLEDLHHPLDPLKNPKYKIPLSWTHFSKV